MTKKQAFFDNTKLLSSKFGIIPLMYGSLGLEYLTGESMNADDITEQDKLLISKTVTKTRLIIFFMSLYSLFMNLIIYPHFILKITFTRTYI